MDSLPGSKILAFPNIFFPENFPEKYFEGNILHEKTQPHFIDGIEYHFPMPQRALGICLLLIFSVPSFSFLPALKIPFFHVEPNLTAPFLLQIHFLSRTACTSALLSTRRFKYFSRSWQRTVFMYRAKKWNIHSNTVAMLIRLYSVTKKVFRYFQGMPSRH